MSAGYGIKNSGYLYRRDKKTNEVTEVDGHKEDEAIRKIIKSRNKAKKRIRKKLNKKINEYFN